MENYIDNLIAKHFANETSVEEEKQLQELISKNKEIEKKYNEARLVWQSLVIKKDKYDLERGRYLINYKIKQAQDSHVNLRQMLEYAAIFIGIVIIGFLVKQDLYRTETVIASADEITQLSLPDNSVVYLNKNSQLTYNISRLKKFNRTVELTGEAFFEIEKQDGKNFIVDAGDLYVQVLGTKFNVKQNYEQTTITLNEGKVMLKNFVNSTQEQYLMKPGDFVSYNSNSGKLKQKQVNADVYNIWTKNRLVFDNFSTADLAEIFRIYYQKELVIQDKDFDCQIKGSAPTDDLNLLLKAFSKVLNKEINIVNDSIIIE